MATVVEVKIENPFIPRIGFLPFPMPFPDPVDRIKAFTKSLARLNAPLKYYCRPSPFPLAPFSNRPNLIDRLPFPLLLRNYLTNLRSSMVPCMNSDTSVRDVRNRSTLTRAV